MPQPCKGIEYFFVLENGNSGCIEPLFGKCLFFIVYAMLLDKCKEQCF